MTNEQQFTEQLERLANDGFRLCPINAEEDDSLRDDDSSESNYFALPYRD